MSNDALRLPDYLAHIAQAIERIDSYVAGMDKEAWLRSTLVQDAVIRNIEIMGEASRHVQKHHAEFANQHTEFPWDDAYWMRNVLAHGYFQVDLDIVWQTITVDLPLLLAQVRAMLD